MSIAPGPQNCDFDVTPLPLRTPKHLEFPVHLTGEIELSDGGCYGVELSVYVACVMDNKAITGIRELRYHHVNDWKINVGPIELTGISRANAEAIFADFYTVPKNRERLLGLCRKANGEAR
jgi:hypothetical protein